ncbi:OmpA family protein [Mucilaginibacter sp. ZT4R22]|uniref:OmpA family protein n=1 Tax=Mucilaginibacter pankratovii TaxID=2772110 RepID=A0ABR7WPH7_9SPHI|nr:OmpA family protein [Mucilaginibacter pankratovii]MBD1364226.1 OmpA family protein [Mucilaginibacter pankratovii]
MKLLRSSILAAAILSAVVLFPACKAKKAVVAQAPAPVAEPAKPAPVETPKPAPPVTETPAPAPAPPNYNFSNIQFEFNSGILKTDSYPVLDKAVAEMKKDPSVKFILNGNSSAEGTDAHNLELSVERATAVKLYLTNSGISSDNLAVKGWGESKPIADNKTEEGRVLNRRVEIKKQ